MRSKVKVTTTIDSELVEAIDKYLKGEKGCSRSKLIEDILHSWYQEKRKKEIEEKTEDYYRSLSEKEKKEEEDWDRIVAEAARRVWE